MSKIVGIGETVLDMVLRNGQPQAAVPGGSVFNALVSLGRTLGATDPTTKIVMITQMGDDAVAGLVTDFMSDNGVSTEGVIKSEGNQTAISMAMLDSRNDARYEFYRDNGMPEFKAGEISFDKGDTLLFGSFFAVSPRTRAEVESMLAKARTAGATIYYDINFRKAMYSDFDRIRSWILDNISSSDIVRGSIEDIEAVFGTTDPAEAYMRHISPLCPCFICTKGSQPVVSFSRGAQISFAVPAVETVSTIGAGDNFNAGVLYALTRNPGLRGKLPSLGEADWGALVPTALRFSANVCGSIYNYVDKDFVNTL